MVGENVGRNKAWIKNLEGGGSDGGSAVPQPGRASTLRQLRKEAGTAIRRQVERLESVTREALHLKPGMWAVRSRSQLGGDPISVGRGSRHKLGGRSL